MRTQEVKREGGLSSQPMPGGSLNRSVPFFSIVLFTKNRSELVNFTIQSALQQSFTDFELIVSDNDDTDATAEVISRYNDPRLRYHRTDGKLSMVDNWECAVSLARGEFVLSLTDRSALKSYALERIKRAIDRYHEDVYVWSNDFLYDSLDHVSFYQGHGEPELVPSRKLFQLFLNNSYEGYSDSLPKGLNSCHSRRLLQEIKQTTGGRVFLPVSPDYTLAFLTLAHRARVVLLNDSLFVWGHGQLGNGRGGYRRSETATRFLRDLNLTEADLFDQVPIKTIGIHNSICNDLLKLKHAFPECFSDIDLDLVSYFVVCRKEIDLWLAPGDPLHQEKISEWEQGLARQPLEIRTKVKTQIRAFHDQVTWYQKAWRPVYNSDFAKKTRHWFSAINQRRNLPSRAANFANIIEAVDWIEKCELVDTRKKSILIDEQ